MIRTQDGFTNFEASLGFGADNLSSHARYTLNPQSRNGQQLATAYRGSWIVGKAIDAPAEDMTRAGIDLSGIEPEAIEALDLAFQRLALWERLSDRIKWARLYGGAIAVMLIEGQDFREPLRIDRMGRNQLKGLRVLDRWMVQPSLHERVTAYGPDLGLPKYYQLLVSDAGIPATRIHHSRVLRMEGVDLPYFERQRENAWGLSVLEPLSDRLVAFASTTAGAAQLVYKAHLRTLKIERWRGVLAQGGPAEKELFKHVDLIKQRQTIEGLTLIDAKDEFQAHTYVFSGLSDMLIKIGQQLAGALGIPLVRLFGQSPAGLNATGESDIRTYYDDIHQKQERRLRSPIHRLLEVLSMSELGQPHADSLRFEFRPLWQLSGHEKAEIAQKSVSSIVEALEAGLLDRASAMKELRGLSHETGLFGSVDDAQIAAAEEAPAPIHSRRWHALCRTSARGRTTGGAQHAGLFSRRPRVCSAHRKPVEAVRRIVA